MGMRENENIYWDVFPKLIRVSISTYSQMIPLSIRGNVPDPVYESSNSEVADIDELGNVLCGLTPGAAMIMVWASEERTSVRHVQVEVYGQASAEVPQ
jgi:hypothetical protein